jgi:hypothetical protein
MPSRPHEVYENSCVVLELADSDESRGVPPPEVDGPKPRIGVGPAAIDTIRQGLAMRSQTRAAVEREGTDRRR